VRAAAGVLCLLVAVGAMRMIVSTDSLARGVTAYKSGDCAEARSNANASLDALDSQPQAAAILGYCDARRGRAQAAIGELQDATRLDPTHWRYRYGLAIVRGMAGRDPRPDLALARQLNPRGELLTTGVPARLAHAQRARWRSLAARAPRPVD
jgi:Flp pilus assembly protein TadD